MTERGMRCKVRSALRSLVLVEKALSARWKRLDLLARVDLHDKNATVGVLQTCEHELAVLIRELAKVAATPTVPRKQPGIRRGGSLKPRCPACDRRLHMVPKRLHGRAYWYCTACQYPDRVPLI